MPLDLSFSLFSKKKVWWKPERSTDAPGHTTIYTFLCFSLSRLLHNTRTDVAENPDSVQVLLYSFIVVGFVLMVFLRITINNISKILSPNTPITKIIPGFHENTVKRDERTNRIVCFECSSTMSDCK